jgi:hypothetical protein
MPGGDSPIVDQYRNLDLLQLVEELGRHSTGSVIGRDHIEILRSMISVRTAEMVTRQLMGTAESIGRSAVSITQALNEASETGSHSAEEIKAEIEGLVTTLRGASAEIQAAGTQSSRLSRRLNWLTLALVFAAVITAGATAFQAYETKRQADITEKQMAVQRTPGKEEKTSRQR